MSERTLFHIFVNSNAAAHYVSAGRQMTAIVRTVARVDICRRHKIEPVFCCPSTTYDFPRCFQVATIHLSLQLPR